MTTPSPSPLQLEHDVRPGVDVITVFGELDIATAPALRRLVVDHQRVDRPVLVLDLGGLEFVDSVGVGAVVAAYRVAGERGARLIVVCREGQVLRVLRLARLEQIFEIRADQDVVLAELLVDHDRNAPGADLGRPPSD